MSLAKVIQEWQMDFDKFVFDLFGREHTEQQKSGSKKYMRLLKAKMKKHSLIVALGRKKGLSERQSLINKPLQLKAHGLLTPEEQVLADAPGLAIKAGQGPGKTAFLAEVCYHLLLCFPSQVKVGVLGIKEQQIKAGLWSELRALYNEANQRAAELNIPSIVEAKLQIWDEIAYKIGSNKADFIQLKTINMSKDQNDNAESIAGLHAPTMGIGLDEGSGIPDKVFETFVGTLTFPVNIMFVISNPTRTTGYFREIWRTNPDGWLRDTWNCEDSPLVQQSKIDRMKKKWGIDSNVYRIRVLGEFPREDDDTFVAWDDVQFVIEDIELIPGEDAPVIIGLDPNGGGKDSFGWVVRKGPKIVDLGKFHKKTDREKLGVLVPIMNKHNVDVITGDANIWGSGIFDRLEEWAKFNNVAVYRILPQEGAHNKRNFMNRRDELWFALREQIVRKKIDLSILQEGARSSDRGDLENALTGLRFKHQNGKLKMEPKLDAKGRGLLLDVADAIGYTYNYDDSFYDNPNRRGLGLNKTKRRGFINSDGRPIGEPIKTTSVDSRGYNMDWMTGG